MARAEEHKIREYLLGQLTEAEEEQVELRLLTEPDFAEEYDIVVNELTDDYIAGKFEGEDLKQVEEHFFRSPQRRNKLKFALALDRHPKTSNQSESNAGQSLSFARITQTWTFRAAAAIAAVTVLSGVVLLIVFRSSSPRTFAALTLSVNDGSRGGGGQPSVVRLPLNADALRITLQLPSSQLLETAVRFRVELESDNGVKKTLESSLHDGKSVIVVIPDTELKRGQYSLKVFAVRADGAEQRLPGNYTFTVE
jgi:methionine-rich copper-binding protein CopC